MGNELKEYTEIERESESNKKKEEQNVTKSEERHGEERIFE